MFKFLFVATMHAPGKAHHIVDDSSSALVTVRDDTGESYTNFIFSLKLVLDISSKSCGWSRVLGSSAETFIRGGWSFHH